MGKKLPHKKRKNQFQKFSGEQSLSGKFRKKWLRKGYELINISPLCKAVFGDSGWCNDFNEPDETLHHVQIRYRDETIANLGTNGVEIIDEDLYVSLDCGEGDFIIYRKVELRKGQEVSAR